MRNLKEELNGYVYETDKFDFMCECFAAIKEEVNKLFFLGRCNSRTAERVTSLYYSNKSNKNPLFPINYSEEEMDALPAVIAKSLRLSDEAQEARQTAIEPFALYSKYFENSYLYGTGTCEDHAIVGAYFLAANFSDVAMSIETLYSHESHSYLRVHTTPEYIFDFWEDFVCEYEDILSWNERFGECYPRNDESRTETNITFTNVAQLTDLGKTIFSEENQERQTIIYERVEALLKKEYQFEENPSEPLKFPF